MDSCFTNLGSGDSPSLVVNNERILFIDWAGEKYQVHFDTGQVLDMDKSAGDWLIHQLKYVHRAKPATQYVRDDRSSPFKYHPQRRRAMAGHS